MPPSFTFPSPADIEPPLILTDLVGDMITAIRFHPYGWRLDTSSGRSVIVRFGSSFDRAGQPAIEPGRPDHIGFRVITVESVAGQVTADAA